MKRILVLFALFAAAAGYAQTVEKQTFVYAVKQTDTLRLDRYVALTPDSRTKPCLMFVFGGGFVGGRRDNASFLSYFEYYARKGYVVVSIDYRLGMKKAMQAGTLSEETFPEAWITTLAMATGDLYDATASWIPMSGCCSAFRRSWWWTCRCTGTPSCNCRRCRKARCRCCPSDRSWPSV